MNVIDKLANFEEMKKSGFIIYDKDGSGTYYKFFYNSGSISYKIKFNTVGRIIVFKSYYTRKNRPAGYSMSTRFISIIDFISNLAGTERTKYIDGWVRLEVYIND